jgi:hypothetical protein
VAIGFLHQLAFLTPGICCNVAISRKQIRQTPNWRMYPCFRPHRKHRRTILDENFGFFLLRAMTDSFAIVF